MNKLEKKLDIKKDTSTSVEKIQFNIPDDLKCFLCDVGGAIGMISDESYINLYSCTEILKYNNDYEVIEFLPGYLLIGTVNDEALVIDQKSNYYVVPFIGMFEKNCIKIAETFDDLLENL